MTPHVNLVIATPGHSLMGGYVKCLLATIEELSKRNITWAFTNEYASHVADAREITLSATRENSLTNNKPFHGHLTYDKILWIDSDINWTPEDVIKLYESDKDIVTGAYLLANGEVTVYPKMLSQGFSWDQVKEMTEIIEVDGAGFGFICVKQGVFESLTRPWFQSATVTKTMENGDKYTFQLMGEDISWCERVREQGFKIWFDPSVKLIHNKMMRLTWEGPMP